MISSAPPYDLMERSFSTHKASGDYPKILFDRLVNIPSQVRTGRPSTWSNAKTIFYINSLFIKKKLYDLLAFLF